MKLNFKKFGASFMNDTKQELSSNERLQFLWCAGFK